MRPRHTPPERSAYVLAAPVLSILLCGCASPPSVVPLLQLVDRELQAEAARIERGGGHDAELIELARERLATGFERDLAEKNSPSAEWVRSAAEAYATAREALASHEAELQQARQQRIDNLHAASTAQRRAILLLTQHDRLMVQTVGIDLWTLEPAETRD